MLPDPVPDSEYLRTNPLVDQRIAAEGQRLSRSASAHGEGPRGKGYNLVPPLGWSGQLLGAIPGVQSGELRLGNPKG